MGQMCIGIATAAGVSADYMSFFKNNCSGHGKEGGTGKPLEMSPSNPVFPTMTKSPSLQVRHYLTWLRWPWPLGYLHLAAQGKPKPEGWTPH